MPVSPAAITGGGSDGGGGGGGGGGGASMMSKLSMPTLPSFGLGAGKEPIAMGDTAEKLKAKFKDGSSVRRRRNKGWGLRYEQRPQPYVAHLSCVTVSHVFGGTRVALGAKARVHPGPK